MDGVVVQVGLGSGISSKIVRFRSYFMVAREPRSPRCKTHCEAPLLPTHRCAHATGAIGHRPPDAMATARPGQSDPRFGVHSDWSDGS
jgi:hypothetical protein